MSLIDEMIKNPSNIVMVGYLDESADHPSRLDISFDNGFEYQIEGVPRELYENLRNLVSNQLFTTEIYYQYKDKIKIIKPE
ncbi:hypothetical protein BANRA_00537 [Acinetobacter baumannii]|nr:hypothetical protein BANRA_00537 [Acinetobacter baumannii]